MPTRSRLKEKITEYDITLAELSLNTTILDIFLYVGNVSSILFFPLITDIFEHLTFNGDMYKSNVFLYAFDDVIKERGNIYIVCPIDFMRIKAANNRETNFDVLKKYTSAYYYDNHNFIFVYKVPIKFRKDYDKIVSSRYSSVSKEYKEKCTPGKVSHAVVHNSPVLKDEWNNVLALLFDEQDIANDRYPHIISEDRYFPEFLIENETYYAQNKE